MGFSAVARVTENKWIACAVKDEINFGLKPGGELELETTICNEIREHGQPVVIDEVSCDNHFKDHHTPKMYGFQSYISIPIFLKDGTFFGTLCAIDPRPFNLKASNMVTMFNLFADLISFHLYNIDKLEEKESLLEMTEMKLTESLDNIRQYSHISRHTLQEPLRKLRLYSDLLIEDKSISSNNNGKAIAKKINLLAGEFLLMIKELTDFSDKNSLFAAYEFVDLNLALKQAITRLQLKIADKKAIIESSFLPGIQALPGEIVRLFYYLLDNALSYHRDDIAPIIQVYSKEVEENEFRNLMDLPGEAGFYCKICVEDNGIGIQKAHFEQIFDLFSKLNSKGMSDGIGMGLSQSKRIMKKHKGFIIVESDPSKGSVFSLIFPKKQLED